jgi:hypothetical protein
MSKTKRAVSKKTEKILRRVIASILEEPTRLDMGSWGEFHDPNWRRDNACSIQVGEDKYVEQKLPPCRTTACIAGHSVLQTRAGINFLKEEGKYVKRADGLIDVDFPCNTDEQAQQILGINKRQAQDLFFLPDWVSEGGWPAKFAARYRKARTAKGRAKITADRIEYFIQTGE